MNNLYLLLSFFMCSCAAIGQMTIEVPDFEHFSSSSPEVSEELDRATPEAFKTHPEFGKLPFNAPCSDCYERLDKRTSDSRYFVKNGTRGSEIMVQTGYTALHFPSDNFLLTASPLMSPDPSDPDRIEAPMQPVTTFIDLANEMAGVNNGNGVFLFSRNLALWEVDAQGNRSLVAPANWSNHTKGKDGAKILNVFPGVDLEIIARVSGFKTNFIVQSPAALSGLATGSTWLITDDLVIPSGYQADFSLANQTQDGYIGEIIFTDGSSENFTLGEAVAYDKSGDKNKVTQLTYQLNQNELGILIPASWLNDSSLVFPITIDPVLTGSNTLAQASIVGSRYNGSCNFTNGCAYNLAVPVPAGVTVTDIDWSFSYLANGNCWLQDGAVDFTLGGCRSPGAAGFYWFCNGVGGGTCTGANISIFGDLAACIPPPQCLSYNMNFTMNFYRSCWGFSGTACSPNCISANSPWTMVVTGRTLEQPSPPASSLGTSICAGASTTITAAPSFGVPPYTYSWNTGQNTQAITVAPVANTTYTATVTDACGNSATNSVTITINNTSLTPAPSFSVALNPPSGDPCPVTATVTFNSAGNYGTGQECFVWSFPGASSVAPATLAGCRNGPPYTQGGGTYTLTYNSGGTFTLAMQLTKGGACNSASQVVAICSLPVELLSFTGERKDNTVVLNWTTASEIDSEKFIVERSTDGQSFSMVTEVDAAGYSNRVLNYEAVDSAPLEKITYYRLAQKDFDGTLSFSEIISVGGDGFQNLSFFPNPTEVNGTLQFYSPVKRMGKVTIITPQGNSVVKLQIDINRGQNNIPLSLENLAPGIYFITLEAEGLRKNIRVVKGGSGK